MFIPIYFMVIMWNNAQLFSRAKLNTTLAPPSPRQHRFTNTTSHHAENTRMRQSQQRDSSIAILGGMATVFMACHSLRFFLTLYTQAFVDHNIKCLRDGHVVEETIYPNWLWPLSSLSHLFLTLNSSANFILYCVLGSTFRATLAKEFQRIFRKPSISGDNQSTGPLRGIFFCFPINN